MIKKEIKKIQRKSNIRLKNLIEECSKLAIKSKFWKKVTKELSKSTRSQRKVNIYKLNKVTKPKENIIIPGKLLGIGELKHDLTIYALTYSQSVKDKIKDLHPIQDLIKKNPQGKGTRIIC